MRRFAMRTWLTGLALALVMMAMLPVPIAADQSTVARWSAEVTTAPHLPQDVWFAGMGNNVDGWHGGGSQVELPRCSKPGSERDPRTG